MPAAGHHATGRNLSRAAWAVPRKVGICVFPYSLINVEGAITLPIPSFLKKVVIPCFLKIAPGLHAVETEIAFDQILVSAFGMDRTMTSPHEGAHFIKQFDRYTNPRALGHMWSLVSRDVEYPQDDDVTHGNSA